MKHHLSRLIVVTVCFGLLLGATPATEAAQLYSNGPLVSVPGGGAGGMDASRMQRNLGMLTLGFGIDFGSGTLRAVADDFTVPQPGWNLTRITVYGYQTGSGFVSTLTDLRLVIMNAPPNGPSAVVFGNPTVNVLAATSFTNAFRDDTSSPGSSQRPIMSASANVNVFLPPGTYWLVWALAGSRTDGPFVPPITVPGQLTTGNGFHLTATGWDLARDSGTNTQQGFPFVIEGNLPGQTGAGASLTVTASPTTVRTGNRFVLSATLTEGSSLVDAFVLFELPGGLTMSLTPGGIVSGVVPFARNFRPINFSSVLLDMPFPSVQPGAYNIRAFLAIPNTTVPASAVNNSPFTVVP